MSIKEKETHWLKEPRVSLTRGHETDFQAPQRSTSDITVEAPCQSHPNLQLKIADRRSWANTDGSCQVQNSKTVIGA
eukprot:609025-Pelagomonas_calceolata.AAC.1